LENKHRNQLYDAHVPDRQAYIREETMSMTTGNGGVPRSLFRRANGGAWLLGLGSLNQATLVYLTLGLLTIVSLFNTLHIISFSKTSALISPSSNFQESSYFRGDGGYAHSFSLAQHDSFGLLDDVSNQAWKRMQLRVKNRQNHKYPQNPMIGSNSPKGWYQENFEPDFACIHEQRVGGMGDGGKWVW
jgi:hypothetical protein